MGKALQGEIIYCARTDRGLKRNVNQDAITAYTHGDFGLFVISDGMGGHSRGELASAEIVKAFDDFREKLEELSRVMEFGELTSQIQEILFQVNQKIYRQLNQGQICGATVITLLVKGERYAYFSVGDSHLYSYINRQCRLLTVDDIWDALPATHDQYTEEQIAENVRSGMLTQAIGTKEEVNIHVGMDTAFRGQVFLLCSDGLYKFCKEKELYRGMKQCKSQKNIHQTMDYLMEQVFKNGAGDNVSAIIVKVL